MPLFNLAVLLLLLFVCFITSLTTGASANSLAILIESFTHFNDSFEHIVIQEVRLPRAIAAVFSGAGMAVSGCLLQGITRNPLASPSLLAINAGATFAVVLTTFILGSLSLYAIPIFAVIGAIIASLVVYLISTAGLGGATPLKMTISGAIISSFLISLTTSLLIYSRETLEKVRFWTAGSLSDIDFLITLSAIPYTLLGLVVALTLGRHLNVIVLGEEISQSLGQNTKAVKFISIMASIFCASGAVAMTGPVAFIGLVAPHLVRIRMNQVNYLWILPYCALAGACIMLLADSVARILIAPQEIPVGICTALIGAPVLILLARHKAERS